MPGQRGEASILTSLPPASRVAVLRLRSLGDCVLTTPALEILRRARPDVRIGVVVESRFGGVFEGNPDVAEILPPEAEAVRHFAPWICLNLHGGTRSAWITALSGAPVRAGFAHFRFQPAYNVRIPRAQEILGIERKVHTAEHLASAMFYLGAERCEVPRAKLGPGARGQGPGTIAVIHACATAAEKTWPSANFLVVAEHLKGSGLEPVFIGGTADDLSAFHGYRTVQGASLAKISELLHSAALFVGNDSGPAHMAAAAGLPVVVIFSASDPEIWGPWRTAGEVVRAPAPAERVVEAVARLRVAA
jgi:ADP-heptose:LPS heptosyltransferase